MDTAVIRQSEILQSELVGRAVMAYETAEDIGAVEHLLVDVKRARVIGLVCKGLGLMGRKQVLSWSYLANIGRDSLVMHTEPSPSRMVASEPELAAAQNMTGLEVWTDEGNHLGRVVDLCLDRATGEVHQYLFALNQVAPHRAAPLALSDLKVDDIASSEPNSIDVDSSASEEGVAVTVYAIAPQSIISAGRKRMMIAEEDAQRSQPYGPPMILKTPTGNTPSWKPEQLPEMPTDFGELLHKGQSFAGKVSEQVRQRARQFTDEQLAHQDFVEADSLPDITEQLQAKTAHVKEQMQAQFRKASQKAREKAQDQMDGGLVDRLGSTSLGRSLGQTLNKFKRSPLAPPSHPSADTPSDSIDVASFEVWEDD